MGTILSSEIFDCIQTRLLTQFVEGGGRAIDILQVETRDAVKHLTVYEMVSHTVYPSLKVNSAEV